MRNIYPGTIFILSILCLCITGCSEDDTDIDQYESKTWELSEYEFFNGEIVSMEEFIYFETIELKDNSTFTKTRLNQDQEILFESTGTYQFNYQDDYTYVYLDHDTDNDFIINCQSIQRETYYFESEFLVNNSSACDWPVLRYKELE